MEQELDITSLYLKEVPKRLLSSEEEVELSKRIIESNDKEAVAELAEYNLPLVISICKRYSKMYGVEILELIGAGNLGLMRAALKFDYRKGCRFSTYAFLWIHQSIRKNIYDGELVRHPKKDKNNNDILFPGYVSWDAMIDVSDDSDSSKDPLQETFGFSEELCEVLQSVLSPNELYVVLERFSSNDPKTYSEIGEIIGITKQGVKKIETIALNKLRESNIMHMMYGVRK